MHHDKDDYPEPDIFKPERFFVEGKLNEDKSIDSLAFGFGRYFDLPFFYCNSRRPCSSGAFVQVVTLLTVLSGL
jgi:hypothetical protein